jgi:hypothetical protein
LWKLAFIDRSVLATACSPYIVCVSRLLAWIADANFGEPPAGRSPAAGDE